MSTKYFSQKFQQQNFSSKILGLLKRDWKSCRAKWFVGTCMKAGYIIQAWIAQLVAHRLGTREVRGSNPGKGENF